MNAQPLKEKLTEKLSETAEYARDGAAAAVSMAKDAGQAVKNEATETLKTVRDAAASKMDGARETLADTGERIARNLHDSADGSEGLQSRVLSGVAGGVSAAADTLRNNSLSDVVDATKRFAKSNPGLFAAGAAVAGFALARFMRSSSAAEERALSATERYYRDAARRTADNLGRSDG